MPSNLPIRRMTLAATYAVAALAFPAGHLMAAFIPPSGLAPGSQYQVIFVTQGWHNAASSDIAVYNAFVTAEAALSPSLPTGVTWDAVVSTPTVNANVNAPSIPGLPIYGTQGQLVALGQTGLYTDALINEPTFADGGPVPGSYLLWTGSFSSGVRATNNHMMGGFPIAVGHPGLYNYQGHWLDDGLWPRQPFDTGYQRDLPFYALSSPITVPTPEPSTLTLLVSALLVVGGMRLLQLRRGTTKRNGGHSGFWFEQNR